MPTPKQELFERGIALAVVLAKKNGWRLPPIKNSARLRSTGLYSWGYGGHGPLIQVNVESTAWLVSNPTVRRQSCPGWKTDRTAMGVVIHELGHHVWFKYATGRARGAWHALHRKQHRGYTAVAEKVSGYEPCAEESFAETFRLWALNPTLLKAACPERYRCLKNAFGLRHPRRRQWQSVLPAAFHPRAKQWIAAR